MRKISIIGAGSIVFCKTLILDVLVTPGLEDTTFCLMDISDQRTTRLKAYLEKIKEKYGLEVQELSKYARGIEIIKKGKREAKEAAAAGREQAAQYHSER